MFFILYNYTYRGAHLYDIILKSCSTEILFGSLALFSFFWTMFFVFLILVVLMHIGIEQIGLKKAIALMSGF